VSRCPGRPLSRPRPVKSVIVWVRGLWSDVISLAVVVTVIISIPLALPLPSEALRYRLSRAAGAPEPKE